MPRIIVKCRYYKNASISNLGNLMKYIARREGVDKLPKDQSNLPATDHQQKFITEMINRNNAIRSSTEYKTFMRAQTRGRASELIASAVENNPNLLSTEMYLHYMATRPRAEKVSGGHGLFSYEDSVDLSKAVSDLENHVGNVYSIIVSLKREDAERLGYNRAGRWRDMIRAHLDEIAQQYNMNVTSMNWYGAFHNESHHPHVHLLLYSTAEKDNSFLTKKGIDNLRRIFGTDVFQDDLREIYDRQTDFRNRLTAEMRAEFKLLIDRVIAGDIIDSTLLVKLEELARRINGCGGKKQYGYLPKGVKLLVDEIVDNLANNEIVSRLYDLWYQAKCSVTATYSDQLPEKVPLSQEKTFKAIRNALVYEATRLGDELKHIDADHPAFELARMDSQAPRRNAGAIIQNEKQNDTQHRNTVKGAAGRFCQSVARVFEKDFRRYGAEDDDIDKKLRREIQAVKGGQNLIMS